MTQQPHASVSKKSSTVSNAICILLHETGHSLGGSSPLYSFKTNPLHQLEKGLVFSVFYNCCRNFSQLASTPIATKICTFTIQLLPTHLNYSLGAYSSLYLFNHLSAKQFILLSCFSLNFHYYFFFPVSSCNGI